jgi:hypothetical protein
MQVVYDSMLSRFCVPFVRIMYIIVSGCSPARLAAYVVKRTYTMDVYMSRF